jgi:osmotically-inducible protein OsmY
MRRAVSLLLAGAFVSYYFDPRSGRRRRHELRDRGRATLRRALRRARHSARMIAAEAHALKARATHVRERPKEFSDETLKQKVMSEAFRAPGMPKGAVNVNVEDGRVVLRGQVDRPDLIEELERRVRRVAGVREVENLVHLPRG